MKKTLTRASSQRGGFMIGMVVGVLVGLALSLGVALYVTKVPVPFVNKVPQRTAVQDAAEIEKNRNWDPNSPLSGKNPGRPANGPDAAGGTAAPAVVANAPPLVVTPAVPPPPLPRTQAAASAPGGSGRDPAAILGDRINGAAGAGTGAGTGTTTTTAMAPATAASRPPRAVSTNAGSDPFTYFVQAGAYGRPEDAEQQRARLAMMGMEARMTEREQAGRTVYRVRVGPFDRKDDADSTKDRLDGAGVEAALVRVQR